MADKEVTVKIKPVVDDDSEVKDLGSLIKEMDNTHVHIPVEVNSEELEELNEQIEDTKSQLDDLKAKVDVDKSEIEDLEAELEELNTELAELEADPTVDLTEIEDLKSQISDVENSLSTLEASVTVDDAEIQDLQSELDELEQRQIDIAVNVNESGLDSVGGKLDEVSSKSEGTESSIKGVGEALAAVAATAGLEKMLSTADNINQSWNRLEITLGSYGVTADQINAKQNQLTAATSRTGGQFREFANTMALAGVHSLDSISNAFYAASAGAQISGNSIETVTNSFQRMAMQGTVSTKVLKNSGVEMEDLAKTLGVSVDEVADKFKSMTPEERLNALSASVKQADKANQDFANSWAGLKNQMSGALAGLMGQLGNAMLPTIASAARIATVAIKALTEGFKALPGWLKNIVGGIGAFVLAGTVLVTTLGVVGKVIGGVKDGLKGLGLLNTCAKVNNSTDCVGKLSKAWSTLKLRLGTVVNVIRTSVIPALLEMGTAVLMNPLTWLIAILVILIAYMGYLYNTNEEVRNSFNKLGDDIKRVFSGDFSAINDLGTDLLNLSDALTKATFGEELGQKMIDTRNQILDFITSIPEMIGNIANINIIDLIFGEGTAEALDAKFLELQEQMGQAMTNLWTMLGEYGTAGFLVWLLQLAGIDVTPYLDGFRQWALDLPNQINQGLQSAALSVQQGVANIGAWISNGVNQWLSNVQRFVTELPSKMGQGARNAISAFASNFTGIDAAVAGELGAMVATAQSYLNQLLEWLRWAAEQAVQLWKTITGEKSPGYIYDAFSGELDAMVKVASDFKLPGIMGYNAQSMVDSWGNPSLTYDIDVNRNDIAGTNNDSSLTGGTVVNNEFNFTFTDYIDGKERLIDLIIRTITDEINWDNDRANRTV